jgi:type IV secretion system protein VirB2
MQKFFFCLVLSCFVAEIAFAASGGGGMPWETPLSTIQDSLTGPVAGVISLIAVVVCGVALIFGGDFSGFVRGLINVVVVISIVVGASSLISRLFGTSGAVIPAEMMSPSTPDVGK